MSLGDDQHRRHWPFIGNRPHVASTELLVPSRLSILWQFRDGSPTFLASQAKIPVTTPTLQGRMVKRSFQIE